MSLLKLQLATLKAKLENENTPTKDLFSIQMKIIELEEKLKGVERSSDGQHRVIIFESEYSLQEMKKQIERLDGLGNNERGLSNDEKILKNNPYCLERLRYNIETCIERMLNGTGLAKATAISNYKQHAQQYNTVCGFVAWNLSYTGVE